MRRAGSGAAAGVVTAEMTAYGPAASAVPPGQDQAPGAAVPVRLACHPNPFNPRTTIEVDLAAAPAGTSPPVRVTIHDLAGRRLRWDGADDRGRPLASGTYLCRASVAGVAAPALKLVLVR